MGPEVHIDNKEIPKQGVAALSRALIAHDEIEKLSLAKSGINDDYVSALGEVLPKLSVTSLSLAANQNAITSLNLSGNKITSDALATISSTYLAAGRITSCLNLSGNAISPIAGLVESIMEAPTSPLCLCLNECGLTDDDAAQLANLAKANKGLKKLFINGNNLSNEGAKALASALESSDLT